MRPSSRPTRAALTIALPAAATTWAGCTSTRVTARAAARGGRAVTGWATGTGWGTGWEAVRAGRRAAPMTVPGGARG